jgi:PKD repeat protein
MRRTTLLLLCMFLVTPIIAVRGGTTGTYTDDFTQADGPAEGWAVLVPSVTVQSGALVLKAPGTDAEACVLVGSGGSPGQFETIVSIEFDLTLGSADISPLHHGGMMFCAQSVGGRYATTCYVVDYLDGNFRLYDMPDQSVLKLAASDVYDGHWRITLSDTTVAFYFQGNLVFSVSDKRWRGGHVGFWNYGNGGQTMTIDNFVIEHAFSCPVVTPTLAVGSPGGWGPIGSVRIPFGANATQPYDVSIVSLDPSVAAPAGHTGGSYTLTFAPGDPQTKAYRIEKYAVGSTQMSVTFPGQPDCPAQVTNVEVTPSPAGDDFEQADGPPENWYVVRGNVTVKSGKLTLPAVVGTGEIDAFMGQSQIPGRFDEIRRLEFDLAFPTKGLFWPFENGGVIFCAASPLDGRSQNPGSCYVVDYLPAGEFDNTGGRFRCSKFVNGVETHLWDPAPTSRLQYEGHWVVDLTETTITFSFNGAEQFTVTDAQFRSGYVGFWANQWPARNEVAVDNVQITFGAVPCPTITPPAAANHPLNEKTVFTVTIPLGTNLTEAYPVTITSTNPAVAVPEGGTGAALILSFPPGGALTQTFRAECLSPGTTEFVLTAPGSSCSASSATFTVRGPDLTSFCDNFSQSDGPPENWTPELGGAGSQVASEKLTLSCATGENPPRGEAWIWAGNPARAIEGPTTYRFTLNLSQPTPPADDVVGRHGGFMFFANDPTDRAKTSGYEIDWIDRADDHGYRFFRFDNGAAVRIAGLTKDRFALGTQWRLVVNGDHLRFFVDDLVGETLVFDVIDSTYREGYFGFWTYCIATVGEFDDVLIVTLPEASFPADPVSGSAPLEVSFDASASQGALVSYAWDFGDQTTGSGATASHTYTNCGDAAVEYVATLTITGGCGLTAHSQKTISVAPSTVPVASFTANRESGRTPLEVSFDASGSQGTIVSYAWDFGDQTTGSGATVSHTYTNDGEAAVEYVVTLTLTGGCGLTAQARKTILVKPVGTRFVRGDINASGDFNVADPVCLLSYLFGIPDPSNLCKTETVPACLEAADTNDDGQLNIADPTFLLGYLFAQMEPPPAPFPLPRTPFKSGCGLDPERAGHTPLGCNTFNVCE